jgi:hypothetical protein
MRERRGCGLFVSIDAGRSRIAEDVVRRITPRVRSDIAQRQRRAGMRRVVAATVFEARGRDGLPKFGAHVVAIMPDAASRDRAIESLNRSRAYGRHLLAKPVTDWAGLTTYLLKEATPQAAYRKGVRRVGGSIPLGRRGGNRVILSNDLREILVNAGWVEPYRRTYAGRLTPRRVKFLRDPPWLHVIGRLLMPAERITILSRPQFRLTAASWFICEEK